MTITAGQVKEARKLLGWTQSGLAAAAGMSQATVNNFEQRRGRLSDWVEALIVAALESAGVEFIAENGVVPGVRLRKTT